ncbi:DUF3575 domain-containing protein [Flavicella sediminum]|uniref:DUF3575 domain-containing protein n=1 Tax=Flavicella sediminum TaxID=2585141 RepID=UPI00111D28AE|nr:DUF3575 domain-containing protein [Flavicella sediminum]
MKKFVLLFACFSTILSHSQKVNEIKVDAFDLIVTKSLEVSYEKILNEDNSIGLSVFVPISEAQEVTDYSRLRFSSTLFYRVFFSEKHAKGFFVEGFGMFNSKDNETQTYNHSIDRFEYENTKDFALGISIGGKWVTKRGFTAEMSIGVGRNLFANENNDFRSDEENLVTRGGISIGKRF